MAIFRFVAFVTENERHAWGAQQAVWGFFYVIWLFTHLPSNPGAPATESTFFMLSLSASSSSR
jgi:hypothetical protein